MHNHRVYNWLGVILLIFGLNFTLRASSVEKVNFVNYIDIDDNFTEYGKIIFDVNNSAAEKIKVKINLSGGKTIEKFASLNNQGHYVVDSIPELRTGSMSLLVKGNWSEPIAVNSIGSNVIKNLEAKSNPAGAKLSWHIDYKALQYLKDKDAKIFIKYITDIDKKRLKNGMEGIDWTTVGPIDIDAISYEIDSLVENENYYFEVGVANPDAYSTSKVISWSKAIKTKTKRTWGIAKFLILIGSLGFFIYGMKIMSEGIQQAAGNNLRKMLGAMTSNRFKGILTGFGITSIVQSSSVTTVMTVSFVNAGLMTLRESIGVMMGANVGTTLTGWLVLTLGFKLNISEYAFMLIALATPLLFVKKGTVRVWAEAVFGFAILFIGLAALKDAVPELDKDSGLVQFFLTYKSSFFGPLMFVILGTLVTVIIQSSSAAMALTLTMVSKGVIPYEVACAMILGENIGTTITATLAAMIGNVHAKRAARIHMMFNVIGVVWMLLIFPFYLKGLASFMTTDPFTDPSASSTGIAIFHTSFNIINLLLLVWFSPQLEKFAKNTVKSRSTDDEVFKLDYIGGPLGTTAEFNILEAKKEVSKFAKITTRMNGFVKLLINSADKKEKALIIEKIQKYEEITDRVEVEVGNYLGRTMQLEMSDDTAAKSRAMLGITTDLERIGDIFYQMSKTIEKKDEDKQWFNPKQRRNLNKLFELVEEAFTIMNENLGKDIGAVSIEKARAKEENINKFRDKIRKEHLASYEEPEYNSKTAIVYSNLFSSLEKVGDHIINVSEAVSNEKLD